MHKYGRMDNNVEKPEIITFYNKTKGGTDTFDQLCKNYSVSRVCKRWPLRIFYGMLDQCGINSGILYHLNLDNEPLNRRTFLKQLSFFLIKQYLEQRLTNQHIPTNIKLHIQDILNIKTEQNENRVDKFNKRKRCSFCSYKDDKKTMYCCAKCKRAVCEIHRTHFCHICAP